MLHIADNPVLKVILIEDSAILRQRLREVLDEIAGVEVVGGAGDERGALELLQTAHPDLAIVDLELDSGSGLGVLSALAQSPERFGKTRAVVFSSHGHRVVRERCRALGVDRFFNKDTELHDLLDYVRWAADP